MPRSQPLPYAEPPFVGRAHEQQLYRQMLASTSPWALVITGDGGVGKSALLRHLAGKQTPPDIPLIDFNFAGYEFQRAPDTLKVLSELAWRLADDCDAQSLAAFKRALAEGRDTLAKLSAQMSQNIIVGDAGNLKDASLHMIGINPAAIREQQRQVRENVTESFLEMLSTYRPACLVMMLDTCEWLEELEGREVGTWVMDSLLPGVHERLKHRRRHSIAVLASRVPPTFRVLHEQRDYLISPLPFLEQEEVDSYLLAEPIKMQDAALRRRVYEITRGHALCVFTIGKLWQERGDQLFTLADLPKFEGDYTAKAHVDYVRERLLKRLKGQLLELTRYGVLLRRFDLPMLQAIFPEQFKDGDALDLFHHLQSYLYIEPRGPSSTPFTTCCARSRPPRYAGSSPRNGAYSINAPSITWLKPIPIHLTGTITLLPWMKMKAFLHGGKRCRIPGIMAQFTSRRCSRLHTIPRWRFRPNKLPIEHSLEDNNAICHWS